MTLISFFQNCVRLLALPIYVLSYMGWRDSIYKRIFFPYFMSKFSICYKPKIHREKELLFTNLEDFTGPSGQLSLLEIGTGTGVNFQFYPPGCQVTCTDQNPNFQKYLQQSMAENQHLQFKDFIVAPGENLHQVPDSSVDVVVSTWVLCSVTSVPAVLNEVLRVLRKGGAFYFMEHVAGDRSSWTYFWQQIYDPTWRHFAAGCTLIREPWKDLENAKFSELKLQHRNAPLNWTPVPPGVNVGSSEFQVDDEPLSHEHDKLAVKTAKKDFYMAEIASVSSCLAQLFRIIRSLKVLPQKLQKDKELYISCEAVVSYFTNKVLLLHHNLQATIETIEELEAPWPSEGLVLYHFNLLSLDEGDRILWLVKPTTQ